MPQFQGSCPNFWRKQPLFYHVLPIDNPNCPHKYHRSTAVRRKVEHHVGGPHPTEAWAILGPLLAKVVCSSDNNKHDDDYYYISLYDMSLLYIIYYDDDAGDDDDDNGDDDDDERSLMVDHWSLYHWSLIIIPPSTMIPLFHINNNRSAVAVWYCHHTQMHKYRTCYILIHRGLSRPNHQDWGNSRYRAQVCGFKHVQPLRQTNLWSVSAVERHGKFGANWRDLKWHLMTFLEGRILLWQARDSSFGYLS